MTDNSLEKGPINVGTAITTARQLLAVMIPTSVPDSVLLEAVENKGDSWEITFSFNVPNMSESLVPALAVLQGRSLRRVKRFCLTNQGEFISMKDPL